MNAKNKTKLITKLKIKQNKERDNVATCAAALMPFYLKLCDCPRACITSKRAHAFSARVLRSCRASYDNRRDQGKVETPRQFREETHMYS